MFRIPVSKMFNHPPELGTDPTAFPKKIVGWTVLVPLLNRSGKDHFEFVRIIDPEIKTDEHGIYISSGVPREYNFYFRTPEISDWQIAGEVKTTSWYQSGSLLIFIETK